LIEEFSMEGILKIFTTWNYAGNYNPLTLSVLAIENYFFGFEPLGYHLVNWFIHLLNVFLVGYFFLKLSKNWKVAVLMSLLFGVHPAHIESVAWVSGIKDLLFTLFFMLGLIFYEKGKSSKQGYWMFLVLLVFLLSLMSKAMAVTFPIILVLIDFHQERSLSIKNQWKKLPLFTLSAMFGVFAIYSQNGAGSTMTQISYPFLEQVSYAGLAFLKYIKLAVFPNLLSPFHPYPVSIAESVPVFVYVAVVVTLVIFVSVPWIFRKRRKMLFGYLFFVVSIFPVLQLFSVGAALIAERYSYLPFLGLFYFIVIGIKEGYESKLLGVSKRTWMILSVFVIGGLSYQSAHYIKSWSNTDLLWTKAMKSYPLDFYCSFQRGLNRTKEGRYEEAGLDLSMSIATNKNNPNAYFQRGVNFMSAYKWIQAINDFHQVIKRDENHFSANCNVGVSYMNLGRNDSAEIYFNRCIEINPHFYIAHLNIGILNNQAGNFEQAMDAFNFLLQEEEYVNQALFYRAQSFFFQKKLLYAQRDFSYLLATYPDIQEYKIWKERTDKAMKSGKIQ